MTDIQEYNVVEPPTSRELIAYARSIFGKGNLMPLVLEAIRDTDEPLERKRLIFRQHQTTHSDDGTLILSGEDFYNQGIIRIETKPDDSEPATADIVTHDLFD